MGRKAGLLIVLGFFLALFWNTPCLRKRLPEKDIKIYIPWTWGQHGFHDTGASHLPGKILKVRIFMENTSGSSGGIAYNRVYKMNRTGKPGGLWTAHTAFDVVEPAGSFQG